MITVHLNKIKHQTNPNCSLHAFLLQHDFKNDSFAVAVNRTFIPRSLYSSTFLSHGDAIDIITPMQGG